MKTQTLAMFVLALAQALAVVIGLIVTAMGFGGLFAAQSSQAEDTGTALLLAGAAMILLALVLLVVGIVAGFGLTPISHSPTSKKPLSMA